MTIKTSELTGAALAYINHDGTPLKVRGCRITVDKFDRYWLWSDQLGHNIVYKTKGRENALLASIDSLLFTIHLRGERIRELQRIANLVEAFVNEVNPDKEDLI